MKTIKVLFLASLFTLSAMGQSNWFWQNLKPQGNDLKAVSFCDRNNGWAVGVMGTVLHTSDGGSSWQIQNSKTTSILQDITCLSPTTAIGTGGDRILIRTTNGGTSWDTLSLGSGTEDGFTSMKFIDKQNGFVMEAYSYTENILFKTTDAGATWKPFPSGFKESIMAIYFVDANLGYATGGYGASIIYKTTNGGITWVKQTLTTTYSLQSIIAKDSLAVAVGYGGLVLKTTNQGATWSKITSGISASADFYSIDFYNYQASGGKGNVGMAVGSNGMASRSTDYGATWTTIMSDWQSYKTLYDVKLVDSIYGFAVGAKGKIMKTTDAGQTWFHLNSGFRANLWSVNFTDSLHGVTVGDSATISGGYTDGKIYTTTDGGNSWKTTTFPYSSCNGVHFPNKSFGCAVGFNGTYATAARTTDGGSNWSLQIINNFKARLWSVFFHYSDNGVAVGDSGMIMRTSDGGLNWTRINTGITTSLYYVTFSYNLSTALPSDTGYVGYAMGAAGKLFKSFDGGINWTPAVSPGTGGLNGMSIVPRKAIYLVASDGIYKSIVYNVYTKQNIPLSGFRFISAATENIACAVGGSGYIVGTTDGGANWTRIKITTNGFNSVYMNDQKTIWAVGEAGTVLKTYTFSVTGIVPEKTNSAVPEGFSLSQNYPNPFNPSTRIDYQVPFDSKIIIDLFNINGQRITQLVNQEQGAGNYSFDVNANSLNGLSSGIYFYRMSAVCRSTGSSYFIAKKMILLK